MSIEAMKQALEALETTQTLMRLSDPQYVREYNAITSLRQAIAEAEKHEVSQEPVAWIEHEWSGSGLRHLHFERREQSLRDEVVNPIWTPLYINPQPKREWVGLTPADFDKLEQLFGNKVSNDFVFADIVCVISAKLKEKNT